MCFPWKFKIWRKFYLNNHEVLVQKKMIFVIRRMWRAFKVSLSHIFENFQLFDLFLGQLEQKRPEISEEPVQTPWHPLPSYAVKRWFLWSAHYGDHFKHQQIPYLNPRKKVYPFEACFSLKTPSYSAKNSILRNFSDFCDILRTAKISSPPF